MRGTQQLVLIALQYQFEKTSFLIKWVFQVRLEVERVKVDITQRVIPTNRKTFSSIQWNLAHSN